jgi:hypothetical protein
MSCAAQSVGFVGNSLCVLARVHNIAQTNITQAVVTNIVRNIYLEATDALLVGPTTLNKTNVVFDTLQTDYGWTDATGYNFRDSINGALLTTAGALRIVYTIVASDGMQTVMAFSYNAESVTD